LAGESTADDEFRRNILEPLDVWPRFPVIRSKRAHIIPDWKWWQHTVSLPLQEHFARVLLNFDSSDRGMPQEDIGETATSRTGEEVERIESHAITLLS